LLEASGEALKKRKGSRKGRKEETISSTKRQGRGMVRQGRDS